MKYNKYKPVGWRGESHRHYLAAKGIPTRYNVHKPGHSMLMARKFDEQGVEWKDGKRKSFDESTIPSSAKVYVDSQTGDVVAFEDEASGEAAAVDDEFLRAAEKRGIDLKGEKQKKDFDEFELKSPVRSADPWEDVTDIPNEVRSDMDFNQGFKLTDAATGPGALIKDAGSGISDLFRFATDMTK